MTRTIALTLLALSLAGCSGGSNDADGGNTSVAAQPMSVEATAARPAAFAVCASCHRTGRGEPHGIGPNLFGTFGVRAAAHEGYRYSPALQASGVVWDDASLDAWLEKPSALVPGSRMIYPGQPDAAKRREIIDYLKTLQ